MIDMLDALGIRKGKEVVGKYYQQLRNPQDTVSGKMWTIIQENSTVNWVIFWKPISKYGL